MFCFIFPQEGGSRMHQLSGTTSAFKARSCRSQQSTAGKERPGHPCDKLQISPLGGPSPCQASSMVCRSSAQHCIPLPVTFSSSMSKSNYDLKTFSSLADILFPLTLILEVFPTVFPESPADTRGSLAPFPEELCQGLTPVSQHP